MIYPVKEIRATEHNSLVEHTRTACFAGRGGEQVVLCLSHANVILPRHLGDVFVTSNIRFSFPWHHTSLGHRWIWPHFPQPSQHARNNVGMWLFLHVLKNFSSQFSLTHVLCIHFRDSSPYPVISLCLLPQWHAGGKPLVRLERERICFRKWESAAEARYLIRFWCRTDARLMGITQGPLRLLKTPLSTSPPASPLLPLGHLCSRLSLRQGRLTMLPDETCTWKLLKKSS